MAYRPSALNEAHSLIDEMISPTPVPDRSRGDTRQIPMFRTQEKWGVGYYRAYDDKHTPENWQGNEDITPRPEDPIDDVDDRTMEKRYWERSTDPVHLPSVFGGMNTQRSYGSEEHRVIRAQEEHRSTARRLSERGGLLGHDAPPRQPHPSLRWKDLAQTSYTNEEGEREHVWSTPEGSHVAAAAVHHDRFGPLVDTAEIASDYQGRSWSRELMGDLAEEYGDWGIVHSDGFTGAGRGAFQKKGVREDHHIAQEVPLGAGGEGGEIDSSSPVYRKWYAQQMDDQKHLIDGLMSSLGRRRPGDSHGPRYTQDRMAL